MNLQIAAHQMSFSSNKNQNLDRILCNLEKIKAQLHVFPEYCMGTPNNGLTPAFVKENAEQLKGPFISQILEKTRELQTAVVFTTFLKDNQQIYNAAILAQKGKVKTLYKKIHLFDALGHNESNLFSAGDKIAIAKIKGFRVGLAICFDLRFPELFRAMAYEGVDLFIVPSAWYEGKYKVEQWQVLTLSRAHENSAYLVAVNQTNPLCTGHTIITSPWATTIRETDKEETSFVIEINKTDLQKSRKQLPILKLSKPQLYKNL